MVTIIDADGLVLGRLCTNVAKRLLDGDDEIAVVNAEKAVVTGKKKAVKDEYKQKREVGTYRKGPFFPRKPDRMVKRTVRGMLPYQSPRGRQAFKRLKCYIGVPKDFEGKKIETIEAAKNTSVDYITVDELSKAIGG